MKIKTFVLCVVATTAVALPGLMVAPDFHANLFAVALVVLLFAYALFRYFETLTLSFRWKRSIQLAILVLSLASLYVFTAPRFLPPPVYENAHYPFDPTDYRYWVAKLAQVVLLPDMMAGLATIWITEGLVGRHRGELGFVVTLLISTLFGMYSVAKVGILSLIFSTGFNRFSQSEGK